MDSKNREIAIQVLEAVGGSANISSVTHCMTRLRFVLKDQSIPKKEEIQKIKGVVGVNIASGQYQVIIGNTVGSVYKELMEIADIANGPTLEEEERKEKRNIFSIVIDFISTCMSPLFTAIIAGGLIKVLVVLLGPTVLGLIQATDDTYILMNALGDAPFYFLPVLISYTASKKLNCNTFLSVMVSSVLIYPDVITLLGSDTATHLFGIIPVTHGSYSSSIIPAMLSTILLKYVEIFVDKITPEWSKNFLKPLLIVLITAPITLCCLAPLGLFVGNGLQVVINAIYNFAPWLAMAILAGFMPFIVMTGMHWAFVPTILLGLANPGYDLLLTPAMLASNIGQAGATFGAALKVKDGNVREMAIPAGISALLAGVTEPAMYGVTLRLKKPMLAACISSGLCGIFIGIIQLKAYAFATPCLTSIVQFVPSNGGNNFIYALIVLVASFVLSFVLSYILTSANPDGEEEEPVLEEKLQESSVMETGDNTTIKIEAPIKGEVIPLSEVKDETFATGILGEGFAIVPSEGKVYAPFDGTCENIFDTLHALGLVSKDGVELLIHVGLETVALKGEPFQAHVKNGDTFKKGDLLLEFDIDKIKAAGCETQTPIIVSNAESFRSVTMQDNKLIINK